MGREDAGRKILVADESVQFGGHMKRLFSPDGYGILQAFCGEDALEMAETEKPELVLLNAALPGIDGLEVCRRLRAGERNDFLPIVILTCQTGRENQLKGLALGADEYIVTPFDEGEFLFRVKNTIRRVNRSRGVNPLTGLPGGVEIQQEMSGRVKKNTPFAVAYADLAALRAFNEVYGFEAGDRVILATAEMLCEQVRLCGNASDFVGHIGGDDFVVMSTPSRIEIISKNLILQFDEKIKTFYDADDLKNGCIHIVSRRGEMTQYPILSISMAIVTNELRRFGSCHKVNDVGREVQKKAKTMSGSAYFKDRRRD